METTKYYLLYDEECALCRWYTRKFIRHGFMHPMALMSYQSGVNDTRFHFDTTRARAEIALVSDREEKVRYGLDSLLFIIGRKWPIMERIGRFFPIYIFFLAMYKFISYNRKIIAPSACDGTCSCDPPFHAMWRTAFIVALSALSISLLHFSMGVDFTVLILHFALQFIFQWAMFHIIDLPDFEKYAGTLANVNLQQAAVIVLFSFVQESMISFVWFVLPALYPLLVGFLIFIHHWRQDRQGFSWLLTVSFGLFHLLAITVEIIIL